MGATSQSDVANSEEVDLTVADTNGDGAVESLDYGVMFGYTYPINDDIGVYGSYYMGMADIVKPTGDLKGNKHTAINVGVTYALPF